MKNELHVPKWLYVFKVKNEKWINSLVWNLFLSRSNNWELTFYIRYMLYNINKIYTYHYTILQLYHIVLYYGVILYYTN